MRSFLVIFAACFLGACGNWWFGADEDPSSFRIYGGECTHFVKYQGNELVIEGVAVPVTAGGQQADVRVGTLELSPVAIREVTELVQALDILQFTNCQRAMTGPPSQAAHFYERYDETLESLFQTRDRLRDATSEAEVLEIVEQGEAVRGGADRDATE